MLLAMPTPPFAIDHVQLAMPPGGEERARAFYGDLLGLSERPKPEPLRARGGCWFDGGVAIHLGVDPDHRPGAKAHPALLCHDLEGLARGLEAAGFPPTWDRALPGVARFYVRDPFGNRLELLGPDGLEGPG
jgi:catechol 2,3-dioxygenase-like lactoylglutathione lyase family enzyme